MQIIDPLFYYDVKLADNVNTAADTNTTRVAIQDDRTEAAPIKLIMARMTLSPIIMSSPIHTRMLKLKLRIQVRKVL